MYKDGPHIEEIKIFIISVDPEHRYSNEAGRTTGLLYGNFCVFNFSQIYDSGTFHKIRNSQIFIFLQWPYCNNIFCEILEFVLAKFVKFKTSRILPDLQ